MDPASPSHADHPDRPSWRLLAFAVLAVVLGAQATQAQMAAAQANYVEGEALVIFKPGTTDGNARASAARHRLDFVRKFESLSRHREKLHCHVRSSTQPTAALIAELQADPEVELAEPNYRRRLAAMPAPNDPNFAKLWALRNTGQTVNGYTGVAGADIRFLDAWGMAKSGSGEIVVAVLDSGIDLTHPDLRDNIWTNPGELAGDGQDNDGNGFVDDVHGYDFADNDADPTDAGLHGTHVSGVIAAVANNSQGVVGAAFQAHIMPLKISSDGIYITTAGAVAAIEYAVMMKKYHGVNIVAINASYYSSSYSTLECSAIQDAAAAEIVFCTAAGNGIFNGTENIGQDNSLNPTYPANYRLPNMIVVAASDENDQLASFSNYGSLVDLAAPGTDVYSTIPTWMGTSATGLTRGATSYAATSLQYTGFTAGITGTLYDCGFGGTGEFPPGIDNYIALIQRGASSGSLTFAAKVTNAMNAGAKAAIIYNNVAGPLNGTLNSAGNWIPALGISQADGSALKSTLPTIVTLHTILPSSVYKYEDGTSAATPYVTAAVAFAAANFPNETAAQRVARIVNHVTPLGTLTGTVLSGGRLNLAGIVDTDGNGLPDWWEIQYFGDVGVDPAADPDGDGFTNLQEYLLGTHPNDFSSRLAISRTEIVQNGANRDFRISFLTVAGVAYQVERNDTLGTGQWFNLGGVVSGTGTTVSVTDPGAVTQNPKRFYRVRNVPL